MTHNAVEGGHLSLPRKLVYGFGDFGFNLYWSSISLYLLYYYTDVLGLAASTAGFIFMIAMIWDGITDPLMGYVAERTHTRWGSYRPYILFGSVPLALSLILMFYRPDLTATGLIYYTLATHVLFRTTYTVLSIPYSSLSARMTRSSQERNSLAAIRMVSATLGGMFVAFMTLRLVEHFGVGDPVRGFFWVAVFYAVLSIPVFLLLFAFTQESEDSVSNRGKENGLPLRDVFAALIRNRAFLIVFFAIVLGMAASVLVSKTLIYYFKYNLDAEGSISTALTVLTGMTALCVPVWAIVARYTSKRNIWLAGSCVSLAVSIAIFLNPYESAGVVTVLFAVSAIGSAAGALCFWSTLPDTVEYGEWTTGVRTESLVFGLVSFAQKVSFGFAAGLLGVLLDGVGYQANAVQTEGALLGIKAIMTLLPAVIGIGGITLIWFYPVDQKLHSRLVRAIAWRNARAPVGSS